MVELMTSFILVKGGLMNEIRLYQSADSQHSTRLPILAEASEKMIFSWNYADMQKYSGEKRNMHCFLIVTVYNAILALLSALF